MFTSSTLPQFNFNRYTEKIKTFGGAEGTMVLNNNWHSLTIDEILMRGCVVEFTWYYLFNLPVIACNTSTLNKIIYPPLIAHGWNFFSAFATFYLSLAIMFRVRWLLFRLKFSIPLSPGRRPRPRWAISHWASSPCNSRYEWNSIFSMVLTTAIIIRIQSGTSCFHRC